MVYFGTTKKVSAMMVSKLSFFVLCLIGILLFIFYPFYKQMFGRKPPSRSESTPLTWSTYHDVLRETYYYPPRLREKLLNNKWLYDDEANNLIDPISIPNDEWQRFINIAFHKVNSLMPDVKYLSKEATVIDFTDTFVYVIFLLPKMEDFSLDADFLFWIQIDRKTGDVLKCISGY
jgi:hypothetical protein